MLGVEVPGWWRSSWDIGGLEHRGTSGLLSNSLGRKCQPSGIGATAASWTASPPFFFTRIAKRILQRCPSAQSRSSLRTEDLGLLRPPKATSSSTCPQYRRLGSKTFGKARRWSTPRERAHEVRGPRPSNPLLDALDRHRPSRAAQSSRPTPRGKSIAVRARGSGARGAQFSAPLKPVAAAGVDKPCPRLSAPVLDLDKRSVKFGDSAATGAMVTR